jgi:hypothetical protein
MTTIRVNKTFETLPKALDFVAYRFCCSRTDKKDDRVTLHYDHDKRQYRVTYTDHDFQDWPTSYLVDFK